MSDAPTLAELLESAIAGSVSDVRTWLPGRIESYDEATRRGTVQVLVMDSYPGEDGTRTPVTHKPLTDVPVAGLGSGKRVLDYPVSRGDLCVLLFASSSIAACKATGRLGDSGDDRHHHLADAIAIPFVLGFGGSPADATAMIKITALQVLLGDAAASQAVLRGEALLSAMATLITSISSAIGTITVGAPAGGTAAAAAIATALGVFQAAAATYTSTKVKVS